MDPSFPPASSAPPAAPLPPQVSSLPPTSMSAPPAPTPYPTIPPPASLPRSGASRALVWVMAGAGLLVGVFVALVYFVAHRGAAHAGAAGRSVVRVVLPTQAGTGFFVSGPDAQAYVVTANHVVDSGEKILVERTVEGAGGARW